MVIINEILFCAFLLTAFLVVYLIMLDSFSDLCSDYLDIKEKYKAKKKKETDLNHFGF